MSNSNKETLSTDSPEEGGVDRGREEGRGWCGTADFQASNCLADFTWFV